MKLTIIVIISFLFTILKLSLSSDIDILKNYGKPQLTDDNIIVQDIGGGKLNLNDEFEININGGKKNDLIVSHSHSSNYVGGLSEEEYKFDSIEIYFNNNYLNGKFSKSLSKQTTKTDGTLLNKYPIILEPVLRIIVTFNGISNEIQMDQFSTIKPLEFDKAFKICKVIESILDISIQPCSTPINQSSTTTIIIDNLLHMGLIPTNLDAPYFLNLPNIDNGDINGDDINIKRLRFIQSNRFKNQDDYSQLLNSNSLINRFSIFNHHNKLCNDRRVDYSIDSTPTLLGFDIKVYRHSIEFNEVSAFLGLDKKLPLKFSSTPSKSTNSITKLTLLNNDDGSSTVENYQLEKSKFKKLETVLQKTKQVEQELSKTNGDWSILKLDHFVKKSGFHRELVSNITLISPVSETVPRLCKIQVLEHLDQGIFVDRYEVDEIERFGGPKVTIYQLIDLEKPSATSTQNYVSIIKSFNITSSVTQDIEITLPIHLRYQNPLWSNDEDESISNTYRQSLISSPLIYISCEIKNSLVEPVNKFTNWNLISNYNFIDGESGDKSISIMVPVGQLNDTESVKFYTLLVTIIGSLLVIITIFITHKKNLTQKKK